MKQTSKQKTKQTNKQKEKKECNNSDKIVNEQQMTYYWEWGEVFAGNHLKTSSLPRFLSLDQAFHLDKMTR